MMLIGNEKLLAARAEIEAVLEKHDIAGHVVLHMPGFLETFSRYNPSYSCATPQHDGEGNIVGFHIRSKRDEGKSAAELHAMREATSNMLSGMGQILAHDAIGILEVAMQVDKLMGSTHTPLTHVHTFGKRQ